MASTSDQEVRCGFAVSKKRKLIWEKEIELIQVLGELCRKYDLRYFAGNGTLLGTVRHQGFIPWDDDVDIVMPRPDYDKLVEVASKELESPFYLHVSDEQGVYYRNYARLRNQNTTAMPMRGWGRKCCNGIFIDIFPLDGVPEGKLTRKILLGKIQIFKAMANTHVYHDEFSKWDLARQCMHFLEACYCKIYSYQRLLGKSEELRRTIPYDKARYVMQMAHGSKTMIFRKSLFAEQKMMPFEGIELPVPAAYDEILQMHYGDYMTLPPVEKRGVHHSIFFDPEKPYTMYNDGKLTLEDGREHFNDY